MEFLKIVFWGRGVWEGSVGDWIGEEGEGGGNLQTARSWGKEEVRGSVIQTRLHAEVLPVVVCHQSTRM